jgi:hypothetical protein
MVNTFKIKNTPPPKKTPNKYTNKKAKTKTKIYEPYPSDKTRSYAIG